MQTEEGQPGIFERLTPVFSPLKLSTLPNVAHVKDALLGQIGSFQGRLQQSGRFEHVFLREDPLDHLRGQR